MGQAANVIDRSGIVHTAYRDGMEQIAKLIPYLRQRKECANMYLNEDFKSDDMRKRSQDSLFEQIQHYNKAILIILGIEIE